jgi:hypothetical protein
MRRVRLLCLLLAAFAGYAGAQTNGAPADIPPATQNGPVIMPPVNPATASAQIPGASGPKGDEIYDIRPPLFFLHSWLWLWIALGTLAAVALLILLWRWFGARSARKAQSAYELALEKLEKARPLMREDDPAPYAVAVSEAIRTYLGQRFNSPSTRRTTEEFLRQMEADPAAPLASHRDLLRDFLQACDLLKFARYQPALVELERVQERAVSFVTATKPAPAEDRDPRREPELMPRTT